MGRVDEWKVFRIQAYMIALSNSSTKNPPSPEEMFPLPYDNLDQQAANDDWIVDFYNNAEK